MPSLIAETPAVAIRRIAVSSMDNNVYVLTAKTTGRQVLIDAAAEPDAIAALLAEARGDFPATGEPDASRADDAGTRLSLVVTTHR
ncbi:MAG: hypothetical protein LBT54_06420, partial [Bifidobacteriaceae bacterium]|nr:hypothetical protein [Bifidobacteriaceae bacterium]